MTYDPDLNRKKYNIRQIAGSYQGSHVSVSNMPCDEEFLYALRINGHPLNQLDALKVEYIRLAAAMSSR